MFRTPATVKLLPKACSSTSSWSSAGNIQRVDVRLRASAVVKIVIAQTLREKVCIEVEARCGAADRIQPITSCAKVPSSACRFRDGIVRGWRQRADGLPAAGTIEQAAGV